MEPDDGVTPGEIWVRGFRCRCGNEWTQRDLRNTELPKVCPKCRSPRWNLPYKWRRKDKVADSETGLT